MMRNRVNVLLSVHIGAKQFVHTVFHGNNMRKSKKTFRDTFHLYLILLIILYRTEYNRHLSFFVINKRFKHLCTILIGFSIQSEYTCCERILSRNAIFSHLQMSVFIHILDKSRTINRSFAPVAGWFPACDLHTKHNLFFFLSNKYIRNKGTSKHPALIIVIIRLQQSERPILQIIAIKCMYIQKHLCPKFSNLRNIKLPAVLWFRVIRL